LERGAVIIALHFPGFFPGLSVENRWNSFLGGSFLNRHVIMEKRYYNQFRKQELLDKLAELAELLSAGRKIDPNTNAVKMQLEAIQVEIEARKNYPTNHLGTGEDIGK
jgi:hypothetical protein